MNIDILIGIFIPFFGTVIGSGLVLFMKRDFNFFLEDFLSASAGGIMTAASVWSLIIPATEDSAHLGRFAFLPSCIGITAGVLFMIYLSGMTEKIILKSGGETSNRNINTLIAVTTHNIPEGMAVGCVYAAAMENQDKSLFAAALAVSVGIAVQNIPEGAVISMPLYAGGMKKPRALAYGALSGIVEPMGAGLALITAKALGALLPYFLTFAAGAMLFVVTQQLIPEIRYRGKVPLTGIAFTLGFMLMMSLDVALS